MSQVEIAVTGLKLIMAWLKSLVTAVDRQLLGYESSYPGPLHDLAVYEAEVMVGRV